METITEIRPGERDASCILDVGYFGLGGDSFGVEDWVRVCPSAYYGVFAWWEGRVEGDEDGPMCGFGDVLEVVHPI